MLRLLTPSPYLYATELMDTRSRSPGRRRVTLVLFAWPMASQDAHAALVAEASSATHGSPVTDARLTAWRRSPPSR